MNAWGREATALVLAGRRAGATDPLAAAAGLDLKCLVPVAGEAMIVHVLDALATAPGIGRILVSVNDAAALSAVPRIAALERQGRVSLVAAQDDLAGSVLSALAGTRFPVLITTADNVLLTPAAVSSFVSQAEDQRAQVGVAFTTRAAVLAAHPDGQRRFYTFGDEAYSNCNLYWVSDRGALGAVEIFRRGGQFAKHPLRIVHAFGLLNLIRFRFGIGSLRAAFLRFSRRFGVAIRPVILADGAVAIDVDNQRTLAIAEDLLRDRWRESIAAE